MAMYSRYWFLSFPAIWYETYCLKQRHKEGRWSDAQYYRAMFSIPNLKPQVEGDKFAGLRSAMTDAISQDRSSARILDMATGCGYQARNIWSHGYQRVYACDLVTPRVRLAQHANANTGIKFMVADMQRLGLPTDFFDAISISAALHDLPASGVQDILRECSRVIRPGGRLLILEPRCIRDWPAYFRKFYAFLADNLDESINMRAFIDLDLADVAARYDFELRSRQACWSGTLSLYAFVQCS